MRVFIILSLFLLPFQIWAQEASIETSPLAESAEAEEPGWLKQQVDPFNTWVEAQGAAGLVIYMGAYAVGALVFFPGLLLTTGAGFIFGVTWGVVVVIVGSNIGAALAFLIARYVARGYIERKFGQNKTFTAIDRAIGKEGGKIVFLLRLTPIMPFSLGNYLFGLTKVKFSHYVLANLFGMLPGIILYVYIGYLPRIAAEAAAGGAQSGKVALQVVAFIATLAVTIYVTRIARRALKQSSLEPHSAGETLST